MNKIATETLGKSSWSLTVQWDLGTFTRVMRAGRPQLRVSPFVADTKTTADSA